MRAVQIDRHGDRGVLAIRDVAEPVAAPGQALVRVVATSLNPIDRKTREWDRRMPFPMTLGWDLAGVVVDPGGSALPVGARVVAMSIQLARGVGTWADLVALPAALVVSAPTAIPLAHAAALPLAGLTALQSLQALGVRAGERLLVLGANGSIGHAAAQLALTQGVEVDGLVRRREHLAPVLESGLSRAVTDLDSLAEDSYDAVFDTAGLDPRHVLRTGGRYIGIADVPLPPVPGAATHQIEDDPEGLAQLVEAVDNGSLSVRVAATFPLAEIVQAHELFEAGGLTGKVIVLL